jgi:hypothetical protein
MIVTAKRLLTGTGTESLELVGLGRSSPGQFILNGDRVVDIAEGYGWTEKDFFDRGNDSNVVEFEAHKVWATEAEAEQYLFKIRKLTLGNWDVYFTWPASSIYFWFKNALLLARNKRFAGRRSIVTWQITAGKIREPNDL